MNNDLISRSALLEDINFDRRAAKVHPQEICERFERFCDYAEDLVEQTPAVDAEVVRHGRWTFPWTSPECSAYSTLMMYEIADYINDAETVDAVEVVRCKDCRHYNHAVIDDDSAETFEVDVCLHKDLFPTRVTPDFYCAHGERKIDAEANDVSQD